jgi:hypothetical protein
MLPVQLCVTPNVLASDNFRRGYITNYDVCDSNITNRIDRKKL